MATAFDLGGLLGPVFGGGELDDLLTPQQRQAIQTQSLLSAASALLQAGGPSRTPTSLGQALGAALEAGQTGAQRAQQSALAQMLTRQKLEEARRGQELQKRIGDILAPGAIAPAAGGEITAAEALAAPGMAAGPTAERAALIGQPRPAAPAMSANEMRAQQYLRAADEYARAGMAEDAKRFAEIAERFMPKPREVVGQPIKTATGYVQQTKTGEFIQVPKEFEPFIQAKPVGAPFKATDPATNKEILVQSYDDGSKRPLEGFGPPREVVLANVDNKIVAIDKSTVAPGTTFGTGRDVRPVDVGGRIQFVDFSAVAPGTTLGKTLAPQVVGGAESGYYVLGGGGGAAPRAAAGAVPAATAAAPARAPAAGAAAPAPAAAPAAGMQPIIPGTGPKPPEAFMKAAKQLSDLRGAIVDYKDTLNKTNWVYPQNIPIPFTDRGIPLPVGEETTAVAARYNSLLMGVKNLYELGALAGPDMSIIERQLTNPASWAGALTSRKGMNEQVRVLEDMLTRAERNLESTYKQKIPEAAITPQGPREGQEAKDKSGRTIVFRNNRWEYK